MSYTPNLSTEQIDSLLGAMLHESPTGEEATRIVARFEMSWTEAALVMAIERGAAKLERDDEGSWFVIDDKGERVWALDLPERQAVP